MNDDLLVKYLLGEATEDESERVRLWLLANPAHAQHFHALQKIWEDSRQLTRHSLADPDAAWQRFKSRVAVNDNNENPKRVASWRILRVAASVVLLLTLGVLGYWMVRPEPVQMLAITSDTQPRNDTLPDGSTVFLNKESSIQYPSRFGSGKRTIILKGEAFFHVIPDSTKPFEVEAGAVLITVLGTSFNVKNRNGEVELVVESGRVRIEQAGKQIVLQAGEKLKINSTDTLLVKEKQQDQLYNYYRSHVFVCDDTPLWRLIEVLNEAYQVHIEFGRPALRDYRWDVTIENESLDQVLKLISETFDITVNRVGNRIILQ